MKRFLRNVVALVAINLSVFFAALYCSHAYMARYRFRNWDTETSLFFMPRKRKISLVLLGSSHARTFSRSMNHLRMEKLLGLRMLNLSHGKGAGIVPMKVILSTFFDRGNEADTIVYFIDPWVLYSSAWNEKNRRFYKNEPFSPNYAWRMYESGVGADAVLQYIQGQFKLSFLEQRPKSRGQIEKRSLSEKNKTSIAKRINSLYNEGVKAEKFKKYSAQLEDLVLLARTKKSRLVFIIPPTLLGLEPGHPGLKKLLHGFRYKYGTPFYDFTNSISDPGLYHNHDHLNTRGVVRFTREFLKPVLLETPKQYNRAKRKVSRH